MGAARDYLTCYSIDIKDSRIESYTVHAFSKLLFMVSHRPVTMFVLRRNCQEFMDYVTVLTTAMSTNSNKARLIVLNNVMVS